jgi:hypothetical protein
MTELIKKNLATLQKSETDSVTREWLLRRMRAMWANLEAIEVATIIGPDEEICILRKPTMAEFRNAANLADVPEPRSWDLFYEITFGALSAETEALCEVAKKAK